MSDNLNYEVNEFNKKNNVITNQNLNFNSNKHVLELLKENSEYIDDIYSVLDESKKSKVSIKEKVTRINFDSSHRNIIPKNILKKINPLDKNCLNFTKSSNNLLIQNKSSKHELEMGDRIILQNVISTIAYLKGGIEFKTTSYFVKILHTNHQIKTDEVANNDFLVKISNVQGVTNNGTSFGNISLSLINKTHILYLTSDDDPIGSEDYYYIKLDRIPIFGSFNNNENVYTDTKSNTKIEFLTLAGLNLNLINSNFPININQVNGFLTVINIINEFDFVLFISSPALITSSNVGGDKMYFSKINSSIQAYTNPNEYTIFLNKNLENIKKVKIISSEFPNTEKVIKNTPEKERNNKLYFQVLEDGDFIYDIDVTPGNYSLNGLSTEIKNRIEQVKRQNYSNNLIVNIENNATLEKSDTFSSTIEMNQFTDLFIIQLFSKVTAQQAIKVSGETYDDLRKRITINHVQHGLSVGDRIKLQNCVATTKVPATILNIEHFVESIIDDNNYLIKLPLHNESNTLVDTGGGNAIEILVPLTFRLLFSYENTIGKIIGFRNVGEVNSTTPFSTIIRNNMPYEYDYFKDSVGNQIYYDEENNEVKNNVIQLYGHNYIIMKCNLFESNESLSTNNINNGFSKILLSDAPGSILFNQHIQLAEELEKPIKTLSEIEFKFLSPQGNLYDFNGLEHSFTLEFYEENANFKGNQIDIKTGTADHYKSF